MTSTIAAPQMSCSARPDRRRQRRLTALVVVAFLSAVGVLTWSWASLRTSSASFADTEVISGNRLGAATLDVAVGGATVLFSASNLAAGDRVAGQLVLENRGSLPFTYRLSSTSNPGPLRDVIDIVAWTGSGGCAAAPPVGAVRWRPLDEPTEAPGVSGPSVGRLASGQSRLVCLAADLPLSAPSRVQGRRLDLIIGVTAEHDLAAQARLDAMQDGAT